MTSNVSEQVVSSPSTNLSKPLKTNPMANVSSNDASALIPSGIQKREMEKKVALETVEDEEDEEEEGEEDEEDEEEPKLKYQRLGANVIEILRKDVASCLAVHAKFLALGTHWGVIYILDFNGDEINRLSTHTTTINELSVDEGGEYIASCSDDGKVCVSGLYSSERFENQYNRPTLSIALDPQFSKKTSKTFVIGLRGGEVILNSKGLFGRKDTIIHSGEGPIYCIKWNGTMIAWSSNKGVDVYDHERGQRISFIDFPKGVVNPEFYRCHLFWENDTTLLVGWADCIKICQIKERSEKSSNGLPDRIVQISSQFQTDYIVSGVAPFGEYLLILGYIFGTSSQQDVSSGNQQNISKDSLIENTRHTRRDIEISKLSFNRPELCIVTRNNEEICSPDELTINGFETCKSTDYRLSYMKGESLFYIVSPRDIVVARPRDLDDHIAWLMERKRYEEALSAVESNEKQLKKYLLIDIGEKYVDYLLANGQAESASEWCSKILKQDVHLWEKWLLKFKDLQQLEAIVKYIPIGKAALNSASYEIVLSRFLSSDNVQHHALFLKYAEAWHSLFENKNILTSLKNRLTSISTEFLLDAAAKLFVYSKCLVVFC